MHPVHLEPCISPGCWVIRIIAACGHTLVHRITPIAKLGEVPDIDSIMATDDAAHVIAHVGTHCEAATLLINHGATGQLVHAARMGRFHDV